MNIFDQSVAAIANFTSCSCLTLRVLVPLQPNCLTPVVFHALPPSPSVQIYVRLTNCNCLVNPFSISHVVPISDFSLPEPLDRLAANERKGPHNIIAARIPTSHSHVFFSLRNAIRKKRESNDMEFSTTDEEAEAHLPAATVGRKDAQGCQMAKFDPHHPLNPSAIQ